VKREAEAQRRAELTRRKLEGQEVVPGIFVGGRLAAQNSDWILYAMDTHNLSSVLNCTPNVKNYFDSKGSETSVLDADDLGNQELQELENQLNAVRDEVEKPEDEEKKEMEAQKEGAKESIAETAGSGDQSTDMVSSVLNTVVTINGESIEVTEVPKTAEEEEEEAFFKNLETLDDDAKLALLESIKLPGDEDEEANTVSTELVEMEGEEAEKEDETLKILKRHQERVAIVAAGKSNINLSYKRIPIDDDGRVDVMDWFEVASTFIRSARERGESVLVHCREGRSRSVTMAIAYMIIHLKMTLSEAMSAVQKAIFDENVNTGFKRQLMELDSRVHGSHSVDYISKRARNATINTSYSDNVSEITGTTTRRSKRPRATSSQAGYDEDFRVDSNDERLAPPTKVRATRAKSPTLKEDAKHAMMEDARVGGKRLESVAEVRRTDIAMNGGNSDYVPTEEEEDDKRKKIASIDLVVGTTEEEEAHSIRKTNTSAMDVDEEEDSIVNIESPKKVNHVVSEQTKRGEMEQANGMEIPTTSPAANSFNGHSTMTEKKEVKSVKSKPTPTAAHKTSSSATSPASKSKTPTTPSKKKTAAAFPVQKNTLLNYFGKNTQ